MALRPRKAWHQNRAVERTQDATVLPVSTDELNRHLRAELSPDEARDLIKEAVDMIESRYGLAIMSQKWKLSIDYWPEDSRSFEPGFYDASVASVVGCAAPLELPRHPVSAVDSVSSFDDEDTETTYTVADVFNLDKSSIPARLVTKSGQAAPRGTRSANAIEVVFTAGYGVKVTDLDPSTRRAVKQLAAYLYGNRGECGSSLDPIQESGAAASLGSKTRVRF